MKKIILILCCGLFLSTERNANAQTATFNYTGATQNWTVPCGVTSITVDVRGAQGGTNGATGGLGARMQGTLTVTPTSVLTVFVGGQGGVTFYAASGGGGSGIVNSGTPLVIAGGGGGASNIDGVNGLPGLTGTTGGSSSGPGGTAGNGGDKGYYSGDCGFSGGGGGFSGDGYGTNGITNDGGTLPGTLSGPDAGKSALNGGAGGADAGCNGSGASGGWGCGGGGSGNYGGGGGGGYSGGGGGQYITPAQSSGGGGGSYSIASSQTNTQGFQSGNGQVIITWVAPAAIGVTATVVSSISCNGGSNGSTHGTVTGGGAPYTYVWTPSAQTNATATGLTAGTYTISVSDACGHTASSSVAITQPAVLAASATTTSNVTCNGGSTGATGSTVTGGTSPYTYAWTGGSTNATATGLTAGSYTLTVHDMNGCSATASTVVTQPNALVIDTTFTTANVRCNGGSTGSAKSVVNGGNSPYTYLWTPGGNTTDSAVGLSAGTYTLMVSDACGASATTSATITQPTAISITSHSAPDNGHGVGTAVVSVSGGVGPYTYLWTGGKTTDSIGGLTKGTYCVDVKDANGCKDSICVVVKTTAGIDGITDNATQIVVYPNPNNGQFTIESSIGGASTVEIYNILGEKVFTRSLSTTKGTNTISVNQPNGVYLYRVISDSGNLLGEGRISIQK